MIIWYNSLMQLLENLFIHTFHISRIHMCRVCFNSRNISLNKMWIYFRSLTLALLLANILKQSHEKGHNARRGQAPKTMDFSKASNFPTTVIVNNRCTGVLLPGYNSSSPKFVVTPLNCVHGFDVVKLGESEKSIQDNARSNKQKTILYSSNNNAVDIALIMLEKPLIFNRNIQPAALASHSEIPKKKFCKVVGWSDERPTNFIVTNVQSTSFDDKCSGEIDENFEKNHKICVTTASPVCQQQLGSALLCEAKSKSNELIWILHGILINKNQCSQSKFVYTKIDVMLKFWINEIMRQMPSYSGPDHHILKTALIWPPKGRPEDDIWGEKILETGQVFKTPMRYDLKPIKKAKVAISGSNLLEVRISGDGGFHFADVLGYTETETNYNCMLLCSQIKSCFAVNYVNNNNWCVLLKTAETDFDVVHLWKGEDQGLRMQQLIFEEGEKAHPPSHKPRVDGEGVAWPAGIAPLFSKRKRIFNGQASTIFKYPWMVKIGGCGASLINEDLSNGKDKKSSSFLLTAAHCMANIAHRTGRMKSETARLGAYRVDLLQDVEYHIRLSKAVIHNDFNDGKETWSDIALVEMEKPVKFNNYIRPVALPTPNSFPNQPKQCVTTGWGNTGRAEISKPLYEINVETYPMEKCASYHASPPHDSVATWIKKRVFCATAVKDGKFHSTCEGDSGGPLVCTEKIGGHSVEVLYGLTSYGFGGCHLSDMPDAYTNVSSLIDWLQIAVTQIKRYGPNSVTYL